MPQCDVQPNNQNRKKKKKIAAQSNSRTLESNRAINTRILGKYMASSQYPCSQAKKKLSSKSYNQTSKKPPSRYTNQHKATKELDSRSKQSKVAYPDCKTC